MAFKTAGFLIGDFRQKWEATWSRFTRPRYQRALDVLYAVAERDHEIELLIVFRKGSEVTLRGMKNGKKVNDQKEFSQLLQSIFNRLAT